MKALGYQGFTVHWGRLDRKPSGKRLQFAIENHFMFITGWWFGTVFIFHFIYGMSSFPLAFIFFRGVAIPPTTWGKSTIINFSGCAIPIWFPTLSQHCNGYYVSQSLPRNGQSMFVDSHNCSTDHCGLQSRGRLYCRIWYIYIFVTYNYTHN